MKRLNAENYTKGIQDVDFVIDKFNYVARFQLIAAAAAYIILILCIELTYKCLTLQIYSGNYLFSFYQGCIYDANVALGQHFYIMNYATW
jgi:hypothetical protein